MANMPIFTDYVKVGCTHILPTFLGYTIDMESKMFESLIFDDAGRPLDLELIPFSSRKGDAMLACVVKIAGRNKQGRLWQELLTLRSYLRR